MTSTPTISISGTSISNEVMTQISGTNSYTYNWDVDSGGAPSMELIQQQLQELTYQVMPALEQTA